MGIILTLILCIVLIILVAVSTGFLTRAAAAMYVGTDPNQIKAHNILISASVVGWVAIAAIIAGGIALAFFSPEEAGAAEAEGAESSLGSQGLVQWIPTIIFGIIAVIFTVIGCLAVAAAYYIRKGVDYPSHNINPYRSCAWVGGLSVGGVGVIIVFAIIQYFTNRYERRQAEIATVRREYNSVQAEVRLDELKKGETSPSK